MGLMDFLLGSPGTGGQRAKEAQALSKADRAFIMQQLGRQTANIDESTNRQMGMSMGGQAAAANAAREAQAKALANVAQYTGNPLAMSSALAQSGTNQMLGQIYQQGAGQRSNILSQRLGLLGQAEGLAGQSRLGVTQAEQNILGSIQDSEPGMLGGLLQAYMGMKGMQGSGDTTTNISFPNQ